jgi:hypothetical protein
VSTVSRGPLPPSALVGPPSARGATNTASVTVSAAARTAAALRRNSSVTTSTTAPPATASGVYASSGTIG